MAVDPAWARLLPEFVKAKVRGRYNLQQILRNTGWLFADRILRLGVGALVGVWVARYLGPEQFGRFSYALAFCALFSALAGLGLDGIVVRDIVRDPRCRDEALGTAFALKACGGTVTFILTVGSIFLLRRGDSLTQLLVAIVAAGTIFQAVDTIDFWFQVKVQSKFTVVAKNLAFLVATIAKIVLVLMRAPLVTFALVGLFETVLGSAAMAIAYRISGCSLSSWRVDIRRARGFLTDSWPLILSGVVIMIYMRIDQVMLGEMVGDEEVGVYSAAVRLAEVWYFIPMAVVSSVFPSVVEAKAVSDELFYSRLQKLYNLMAFMGYAVAVPTTLLAGPVITLLFGKEYVRAGPMLSLLIWAGLFTNLGVARSSFLTTMNWTRAHFVTVFLGCCINVVLNYLLIPSYGGMGAVIASCVAYWFAAHGACFMYEPLYKTGAMLTKAIVFPRIW